jgi:hypothetical protein
MNLSLQPRLSAVSIFQQFCLLVLCFPFSLLFQVGCGETGYITKINLGIEGEMDITDGHAVDR